MLAVRDALALDFYGCIRLVNFVRRWRAGHPDDIFVMPKTAADFQDEIYLQPVVRDDPLLQYDYESSEAGEDDPGARHGDGAEILDDISGSKKLAEGANVLMGKNDDDDDPPPLLSSTENKVQKSTSNSGNAPSTSLSSAQDLPGNEGANPSSSASIIQKDNTAMATIPARELAALRNRLGEAEEIIAQLQQAVLALREAAEASMLGGMQASVLREDSLTVSKNKKVSEKDDDDDGADRESDGYFGSYAHFGIHEEMIKDHVRTESYRDAILRNAPAFAGKVVLDVGCGTGILSMFAARAGARKVYAVDNSDIVVLAKEIVRRNGLDGVIEVIRGKMEHVSLPEKVDFIISEWMGYGLLFESMLDSVLGARDAHLAPGGSVLPDKSALYIVGLSDEAGYASHVRFWESVHTFDMTPMKEPVLGEAMVGVASAASVTTTPAQLVNLDMMICTVNDLVFHVPFVLTSKATAPLTAFCIYFDILFEEGLLNPVCK